MKNSTKFTPNEFVFCVVYYILQLLILPAVIMAVDMLLGFSWSEAEINFLYFAINFLALTLILHKFLLGDLRIFFSQPWYHLRWAGVGFLMYYGVNFVLTWILLTVDPTFANINDMAVMNMVQDNFTLMSIGVVLLAPVAEELFYRGMIFRTLFDKHPIAAYGLSMVLFSCIHVVGYIGTVSWSTLILCFIQYFPPGFALTWSYRRSGSILTPMLIHMNINQIGILAMR